MTIIGLYQTGFGIKRIKQYLSANVNHSLTGITCIIRKWNNDHRIGRKVGSGRPISAARRQARNDVKRLLDSPR